MSRHPTRLRLHPPSRDVIITTKNERATSWRASRADAITDGDADADTQAQLNRYAHRDGNSHPASQARNLSTRLHVLTGTRSGSAASLLNLRRSTSLFVRSDRWRDSVFRICRTQS
jgi:hypothetical protein